MIKGRRKINNKTHLEKLSLEINPPILNGNWWFGWKIKPKKYDREEDCD